MTYSIGLDIGVASVGWVCITPDYQILKYNNRPAMGVHEFESAMVAANRRVQRGTRRRYNRRKKRLQLLQQLFSVEMNKLDANFFSNNDSKHFWKNSNEFENRTLSETLKALKLNPKTFPTMYHVRHEAVSSNEKLDLRLIYLALHHLVKFRGHFLNENFTWQTESSSTNLVTQIAYIIEKYIELNELEILPKSDQELQAIQHLLLDTKMTKSDRLKQLKLKHSKELESLYALLLGLKTNGEKLFSQSDFANRYKEEKLKLQISSEDFETKVETLLEDEQLFLEQVQPLYQQIILNNLLQGASYVSQAKVHQYETFERQLKDLKYIIDKYTNEKTYRRFFITPKKIMQQHLKGKPCLEKLSLFDQYIRSKKGEEGFKKQLMPILKESLANSKASDHAMISNLILALDNELLLTKLRSIHNASIPHQNNVYEAVQILKNQQAYYPFITDAFINKVQQIISFRIPYYIGPLGDSEFSWLERRQEGHITPFNFSEKVNLAQTAENFIERMKNKCTYLKNESVLPKHSLLYEKFELLNELNTVQLRFKGEQPNRIFRLDEDVKQWAIENIFKQFKTVTHEKFLKELEKYPKYDDLKLKGKQLFGTQKEKAFASSLATHIRMKQYITAYGEEVVEQLIYALTVFTETAIKRMKVKEIIPTMSTAQLESVIKLNFSGWGRLSEKLMNGLVLNNGLTVIETMEKYPKNFMEILADTNLDVQIKNSNPKMQTKKITYEDVQELHGSPAIKRGIWRAIKIVEELTSIFGEPASIVLEVARENQKSRIQKSNQELFEQMTKEWKNEEAKLFAKSVKNMEASKFREEKFWLYVTQLGKCMYTGEPLKIADFDHYDIDHIYPRSFIVDNSFDNRVLVKKLANMRKGNLKTPLEIIPEKQKFSMMQQWQTLHELKLISKTKYERLMKQTITDQDKQRFINRQLVETRQIIVHVKDLLEERFAETTIHLIKASIVSKFRKSLELPKIRQYNNKHHAIDAFMSVLLVQFLENEYGKNIFNFQFNDKFTKKITQSAQTNTEFFAFRAFKKNELFLKEKQKKVAAIEYVHSVFYDTSWQTTKLQGASEGMFYKETIYSPREGRAVNYSSEKTKRFVHSEVKKLTSYCIQYTVEKKGKQYTYEKIVDMNVIDHYQMTHASEQELALQLIQRVVKEPVLSAEIVTELPKYQKIVWQNQPFYFISSGELHNAKQWELPKELLEAITSKELKTYSKKQLQQLFNDVLSSFFTQYPIYDQPTFKSKVDNFSKVELVDVESFMNGLDELFKSAAANATRSEKFGSRLSKSVKPEEIEVIYESITGLYYRKPKKLNASKKKQLIEMN